MKEGVVKRKRDAWATKGTDQYNHEGEEWVKVTGKRLPVGQIVRGKKAGAYDVFISSEGRAKRVWSETAYRKARTAWTTGSPDGNGRGRMALTMTASDGTVGRHTVYLSHLVYLGFHHRDGQDWPEVIRHLDDDKTNDAKDNIAGGTQAENIADAIQNGTARPFGNRLKRVKQIHKVSGEVLGVFCSLSEAGRRVKGAHRSGIYQVISGKLKSHAGYRWSLAD